MINQEFLDIKYNPKQIPSSELSIFSDGANCQLFAYSLLSDNGYKIPPFRSSELWDDEKYTNKVADELKPFDIILYHNKKQSWGSHVGLFLGNDKIVHLSQENGYPKIQTHKSMAENKKYRYFIGAKRLKSIL
jgi:cell wall-associated NlpC family hydrolase